MSEPMRLQAVHFLRVSSRKKIKPGQPKRTHWETGFARVQHFGAYDVLYIIDSNGDKVPDIWDYNLIDGYPGAMAEVQC